MESLLTDSQKTRYQEFQDFVCAHVEPAAAEWDREQRVSDSVISSLARAGYLASTIPAKYGGKGWDTVTFALLSEAVGRGTSALADLLTIQSMVSMTLVKWGTDEQKAAWLPPLGKGEMIGAYAMTEPGGGSDLRSLKTEFTADEGNDFRLNGQKTWISFGQTATVFLVFGLLGKEPMACLVHRNSVGLKVRPIEGMMGFRAAGLAVLEFKDVHVPVANLIGKPGAGLSYIAPVGLQYGRISTACSALGLLRGCFEESASYAANRRVGNAMMGDLGMIRSMIARMGTDLHAAGLLCYDASRAMDDRLPDAFTKVLMAKYFASKAAMRAASDAVQIRGASGCNEASKAARYYRDAKVMEIIEGTSQIHEDVLGKGFVDAAIRR